jgi:Protein of unknown function (Hypoth_ymh)
MQFWHKSEPQFAGPNYTGRPETPQMTNALTQSFPTFESLLDAQLPDVAHALLANLPAGTINSYGIVQSISTYSCAQHSAQVARILSEAFQYLVSQNFLVCDALQQSGNVYFMSRLGKSIIDREKFEAFRLSKLLPIELLHPIIARQCMADYMAKNYAGAVRDAWLTVEDAIRRSGPTVASANGSVPAARNAFATDSGPLTDPSTDKGEREALMHLVAGALGYYRDAHTLGDESDPVSAGQVLAFASNLLTIIESRLQVVGISLAQ